MKKRKRSIGIAASLIGGVVLLTGIAMQPLDAAALTTTHCVSMQGAESRLAEPGIEGWLSRSRLMMSDGNYQGAADQLRMAIRELPEGEMKTQARCLLMRSLLMAGDDECLSVAEALRARQGTAPAGIEAMLTIGDWYFFSGDFGRACLAYSEVADASSLPVYAYRIAVSQLRTGAFDKGIALLRPLAAHPGPYALAAKYYLAWADYARGNHKLAYDAFSALKGRLPDKVPDTWGLDEYMPVNMDVDCYLAQIEFSRGEYERVATSCRRLLAADPATPYAPELNRLAGESLFKLGDLNAADPYLQAYLRLTSGTPASSAAYAAAAIAYNEGRDNEAATLLEPLTRADNALAQGAALLLGQMAAAKGDDAAAALYFDKAWRTGYDYAISERALYNLMTVMARGADLPFASTTALGEEFLRDYPSSAYEPKVREMLSAAYFRDKNYARALESLSKIPNPNRQQRLALQTAAYELGVELLSNDDYAAAELHLQQAAQGADSRIATQANLWLGQALYAQGKFQQAERAYKVYLKGDPKGINAAQATYDAAYALYMQDNFAAAAREFEQALAMPSLPQRLRTDATVRLADCHYYQRDYTEAARLYAEAERAGDGDAAYAALRGAMMQGLRGNYQAEASALQHLVETYPDSRWLPAALYELGTALTHASETGQAIEAYRSLANRYPQLEEGRRAQLQLATLYLRGDDADNAIAAYQELIRRWPTSDEAKAADVELRRLMAARGQLTAYAAFMNSVPGAPRIDNAELERLAYDAADSRLIASPADRQPMLDYLRSYPDGLWLAAALWCLAQAYDDTDNYQKALECIDELQTRRPDATQLPEALMLKAEILEEQYPGRKAEALDAWRKAEKLLGANTPAELYAAIMRLTDNNTERLDYAAKLRTMGNMSATLAQETDYYEALALAATGHTDQALTIYRRLAQQPSSLYGAKGAVALGELLLQLKKYKEAEKELSAFTNAGTPHAYWLARGYIALADAVAAQGRRQLARQYITALKDNYPGHEADIMQAITDRLKKY